MFCCMCGDELSRAPVIDVLIRRYRCPRGHLFYQGGRPRDEIPDPGRVKEPKELDDRQLLEFWLGNMRARREVPDDLAALCRRLIDLETIDVAPQRDFWPRPVAFCFVCGSPTVRHGRDLYMDGYLCERGHQLWERGGHMHLTPPDHERVQLDIEPNPWWAAASADNWLADQEHTTPYITPALRGVIGRARAALGPALAPGVPKVPAKASPLRSVAAVVAGYLVFDLSAAALFRVIGHQSDGVARLLLVIYGIVFAMLAGAVAAKIAPRMKTLHAMVVGALIVLGAIVALVVATERWPLSAVIFLMAPATIFGGAIGRRWE